MRCPFCKSEAISIPIEMVSHLKTYACKKCAKTFAYKEGLLLTPAEVLEEAKHSMRMEAKEMNEDLKRINEITKGTCLAELKSYRLKLLADKNADPNIIIAESILSLLTLITIQGPKELSDLFQEFLELNQNKIK
jgi:transcription elongation factor Elf1